MVGYAGPSLSFIVLLVVISCVLSTILGTAGWCLFSTYARWLESTGRKLFAALCALVIITDIVCLFMLFRGGTGVASSFVDGEHALYGVNVFLSPILFFVAPIFTMVSPFVSSSLLFFSPLPPSSSPLYLSHHTLILSRRAKQSFASRSQTIVGRCSFSRYSSSSFFVRYF